MIHAAWLILLLPTAFALGAFVAVVILDDDNDWPEIP